MNGSRAVPAGRGLPARGRKSPALCLGARTLALVVGAPLGSRKSGSPCSDKSRGRGIVLSLLALKVVPMVNTCGAIDHVHGSRVLSE